MMMIWCFILAFVGFAGGFTLIVYGMTNHVSWASSTGGGLGMLIILASVLWANVIGQMENYK